MDPSISPVPLLHQYRVGQKVHDGDSSCHPPHLSYKNTGQYHITDICCTLLCTHTCFISIREIRNCSIRATTSMLNAFFHSDTLRPTHLAQGISPGSPACLNLNLYFLSGVNVLPVRRFRWRTQLENVNFIEIF